MLCALQQGHVDVLAGDVLNRRIVRFAQRERFPGVGDDATSDGYDDPGRIGLDRDRMLGSRDLDRLGCHSVGLPDGSSCIDQSDFRFRNVAIILTSLCGFAFVSQVVNMIAGIVFLVFFSGIAASSYSWKRNIKISVVLILIAFAFRNFLGLNLPLY
jgi:hypothetical protein